MSEVELAPKVEATAALAILKAKAAPVMVARVDHMEVTAGAAGMAARVRTARERMIREATRLT